MRSGVTSSLSGSATLVAWIMSGECHYSSDGRFCLFVRHRGRSTFIQVGTWPGRSSSIHTGGRWVHSGSFACAMRFDRF